MTRLRLGDRNGVVLVEVLVATVILAAAAMYVTAHLGSTFDRQRFLSDREAELDRAERVLTATALLARSDLERRIGLRHIGEFVVWIDRPEPSLFRIGVAPGTEPAAEIISTLVYRPAPAPLADTGVQ